MSANPIELLREARAVLETWRDVVPAVSLCADIDAALAQAEAQPKQELVAWVERDGDLVWHNREAAIGRNLYITPQPAAPAVPVNTFRLLAAGEIVLPSDEFIDDDCSTWLQMDRWAIGMPWHAGLKPVRRLLAAAPEVK